MSKQQELTQQYLDRAEELLGPLDLEPDTIAAVIDIVADCVEESMHAGAALFPYQIAQQRGKVKIEGLHGEAPQDGINTHYYWAMQAGFAEQAEAEAYINMLREANPGTQYGLFAHGLPVDYE